MYELCVLHLGWGKRRPSIHPKLAVFSPCQNALPLLFMRKSWGATPNDNCVNKFLEIQGSHPLITFFLSHRNLFISTSNPMSVVRNLVLKVITSVCNSTFKTKNMKKTKEYWWDSIVSSGMIFQLKDILNVLWVIERNFSLFWGFFLSPVENIFVSVPGYNPIFRWLGFGTTVKGMTMSTLGVAKYANYRLPPRISDISLHLQKTLWTRFISI